MRQGVLPNAPERGGLEVPPPRPEGIPPLPALRYGQERLRRRSFRVSPDIRCQLEGGIETLELALARYALLEKALLSWEWQQQTLRRLYTLRSLVRQEPEIQEALVHLHQRARSEDWPETAPALGLARKVERLRSRLEALTYQRLDMPADREFRLVDRLAHMEQLLSWTIPPPVSSEERVLRQGTCERTSVPRAFLGLAGVFLVIKLFERVALPAVWTVLSGGITILFFLLLLLSGFNGRGPGRFWLTRKRLVWQPPRSEPIHIPLQAIRPGGVERPGPRFVRVGLVDGRHFLIESLEDEDAEVLAALLKLHCPASPPGESHEPVHREDSSTNFNASH